MTLRLLVFDGAVDTCQSGRFWVSLCVQSSLSHQGTQHTEQGGQVIALQHQLGVYIISTKE